jgi:hypothetical protein
LFHGLPATFDNLFACSTTIHAFQRDSNSLTNTKLVIARLLEEANHYHFFIRPLCFLSLFEPSFVSLTSVKNKLSKTFLVQSKITVLALLLSSSPSMERKLF